MEHLQISIMEGGTQAAFNNLAIKETKVWNMEGGTTFTSMDKKRRDSFTNGRGKAVTNMV